jgi:hypothetical protein
MAMGLLMIDCVYKISFYACNFFSSFSFFSRHLRAAQLANNKHYKQHQPPRKRV